MCVLTLQLTNFTENTDLLEPVYVATFELEHTFSNYNYMFNILYIM